MARTDAFGRPVGGERAEAGESPAIGVGVIGLSASGGWGAGGHLPALTAAGGFELRALVAGSADSSRAASERYGVPAYGSAEELAHASDVDLVVVAVKTPAHRDLLFPTISAGKAVFVEWPFATSFAQAQEMESAARGVTSFVGLQGRSAPALQFAADLIREGYVGEVLSTTVSSSLVEWGSPVSERMLYTLDARLGATMLGIGFGHMIDAVAMIVGELRDLVATTAVRRPRVPLGRTGRLVDTTAEDQIAISGTLESGAVLSVHQRSGTAAGASFSMRIDGSAGTLELTAPNHPHLFPVRIRGSERPGGALSELSVPAGYDRVPRLAGSPLNSLANAYVGMREGIRGRSTWVPAFSDGTKRHGLLDAISRSAKTGTRVTL